MKQTVLRTASDCTQHSIAWHGIAELSHNFKELKLYTELLEELKQDYVQLELLKSYDWRRTKRYSIACSTA